MIFSICTLGCKVNQYESDAIAEMLRQNNFEVKEDLEFADYYIINSCAVTAEAERKSRQMVSRIKKINPNAKIAVIGCASQKNPIQFKNIDNVVYIGGNAKKLNIENFLNNKQDSNIKLPLAYEDCFCSTNARERGYVKIQDGCDNFCSYCIIPYLRGRSRSRSENSIYEECVKLSETCKEIVLTAINLSAYGKDIKSSLAQLMKKLSSVDARIRLGSLEVGVINEELLKALKDMNNFCPHFHLSLQSGDDYILKKMNRHYTSEEFLEKVNLIRRYFNNPSITTDIIVGFPFEEEENFKNTCKTALAAEFSNIHIFPYSAREGTVAFNYLNTDKRIVKRRENELKEIKDKLFVKYNRKFLGKTLEVLIEESLNGAYFGYSENYIRVKVRGKNLKIGEIYKVKINKECKSGLEGDVMENCLFCKIINGEVPSTKLYEDDKMLIIKDVLEEPKIHYLLIPKKHFVGINDKECDFDLLKECLVKLSELTDKLGLKNGYRLAINYGGDSGQSVPHLHIHILGGEKLQDKFW